MGLINLEPTLHQGERVLWRRPAALSLSDRMVAGVLYVTSESLLFMPNRFNRRRDIVSTRLPVEQLTGVDTIAPVRSLGAKRNGGMRRRLRIRAGLELPLLFVINHPDQVAGEITAALRGSPEQA
jgi:hypothetical protein